MSIVVLVHGAAMDGSSQCLRGKLHAVADSKDWKSKVKKGWVALGGIFVGHAAGAAGKDNTFWGAFYEFFSGRIEANNFAVDFLLA